MKLDLPRGRRKMNLLWQRGRVYAFGNTVRPRVGTSQQLAGITVFLAVLSAIAFGGYHPWPIQLMIVLSLVIGGILAFSNWESRRGTLVSGNIIIDAGKQTLELPAGNLSGTYPLEDFDLVLESDLGPDAINEFCWWVAMTTTMDARRERSFSFSVRLYGPGDKGSMEMARLELSRRLSPEG